MPADIRWIHGYVLSEGPGGLGTVCIYRASSPEKIREHASRADLPVTEIIPIADTVIVRPDPTPAAQEPTASWREGRSSRATRRPSARGGAALSASCRSQPTLAESLRVSRGHPDPQHHHHQGGR